MKKEGEHVELRPDFHRVGGVRPSRRISELSMDRQHVLQRKDSELESKEALENSTKRSGKVRIFRAVKAF